jgi:hypothetical protein
METTMRRSIVTIAVALAIVSLGSLASQPAQAGNGGVSAPSKYNYQFKHQNRTGQTVTRSGVALTEFSSSSAPTTAHGPKR